LLPSVLTLGILIWAFSFLNSRVAAPINSGVRSAVLYVTPMIVPENKLPDWMVAQSDEVRLIQEERARSGLRPLPEAEARSLVRRAKLREFWGDHWYLRGIGFVLAILFVYLAGVLVGNLIGRRVYLLIERSITRVPIVKQVYPSVKQVTDFLLGSGDASRLPGSGKVVLVEYPRKGIWTVGLLTGSTMQSIQSTAGVPCVTIFIPSSPTPFTGYTITVPSDEVMELDISLDEALRFIVSGGVLVPESQKIEGANQEQLFTGSDGDDTDVKQV
jgi:uncharacterized membrane protein